MGLPLTWAQAGIGCPIFFDSFFGDFGKGRPTTINWDRLDPAYKIFFSDDIITIGDTMEKFVLNLNV